ncbi:MAG: hypothetical protein AAGG75_00860 [Bacteroidota bacterium]
MKTIKSYLYLLAFSMLIGLHSCKSDDEPSPDPGPMLPSYIIEESAFGCSNYRTIATTNSLKINHALEEQGLLVYAGSNRLIVNDAVTNDPLLDEEITVKKLVAYKGSVMVCAEEGLYEIDDTPAVNQRSDRPCRDILVTTNGELLLTLDGFSDSDRLFKWDEIQGLQEYSDEHPFSCVSLNQLTETSNGNIWCLSCRGAVSRYSRDGAFLDFFDEDVLPGVIMQSPVDRFLDASGDEMIYTSKRGPLFYQVLKFRQGEWITLFETSLLDSTITEQDAEFMAPDIESTLIRDDKLYVATDDSGCRGIHVFDITKNEPLQPADYYVVRDPGLVGQCVNGISTTSNGDIIVTNLAVNLTIMDCN